MSNETHSHSNIGVPLSEFEVLLANVRSNAAMSQSPTLSDVTKRLQELAARENVLTLKCRLIINKRQIEDEEIEQIYIEEDEKYRVILAARAREEEQCRERPAVEGAEIRKHRSTLHDKEDARCFIRSYRTKS